MSIRLREWTTLTSLFVVSSMALACGGGKKEEEAGPPSLSELASAIESPTGTLDAGTAGDVARAFEESQGVPTGGSRDQAAPLVAQDVEGVCDTGSISVDAASNGAATVDYNRCCIAGCCIDGNATIAYDSSGSADYMMCADYDLSQSCDDGLSVDMQFTFCTGSDGTLTYAVEVNGDTFAVSGYISNGSGTLTVTGVNGSYTCQYTDYAGSCESSTGDSFTF
jgi:hypothetical protein